MLIEEEEKSTEEIISFIKETKRIDEEVEEVFDMEAEIAEEELEDVDFRSIFDKLHNIRIRSLENLR